MRVAVVTLGTTGDLLPYVALAQKLRERGHHPYLVVPDSIVETVEGYGVPARPFGDISRDDVEAIIRQLVRERNLFKHPGIVAGAHARENAEAILRATVEATRDADVIVAHNLALMGLGAAELQRKPLVTVHLFPNLVESQCMTPDGADFGRALNALGWTVGRAVVRRSADPVLNALFRTFGLRERREGMLATGSTALLDVVAISPSVLPRDPAWPGTVRSTGFWYLDEPAFEPSAELRRFLAGGDPPVIVTFGSLVGVDAAAMTRTVAAGIADAGCRAIVQAGWQTIGDDTWPRGILKVGYVPHAWLFPRALCAITHGGAGTTAAALRAGISPVAVAHYGDQRFWALHSHRIGAAPRPLRRDSFTSAAVTDRLRMIVRDTTMKARMRALGERIRAEDGTGDAVTLIEHAMAGRGARNSEILETLFLA